MAQVTTLATYGTPVAYGLMAGLFGGAPVNEMDFALQLAGPVPTTFLPPYPTQQCQAAVQGVSIVIQVLDTNGNPVSLRAVTGMKLVTVRPNGVIVENPAAFYTNGLDGKMSIVSSASVPAGTGLDQAGIWYTQGRYVDSDGHTQFTTVGSFSVIANLGA